MNINMMWKVLLVMGNIQKWGFGMAPIKPETEKNNRMALCAVSAFVSGDCKVVQKNILNDISVVKGIFNRVIKQNQWDWFTVNMYLDYPRNRDLVSIVSALSVLRRAINDKDDFSGKKALDRLVNNNFLIYCNNYLSYSINSEPSSEYLYILSRREEKDILKIGMTTRNVQKRVNEINSATGVVYPYSARKVYKVKDSRLVEKEVHLLLAPYRIREDREFFQINFSEACSIIEEYLVSSNQYYYK